VILPELLRRILAADSLEDFLSTGMLILSDVLVRCDFRDLVSMLRTWNLVRSYTSSSTMIQRLSGLLCDETSLFENEPDMFAVVVYESARE